MCYDVPSYRFFSIAREHASAIDLSNDLVRNDDSHLKFIGDALQGTHELSEMHLTRRELSAPTVIRPVECGRAVDH